MFRKFEKCSLPGIFLGYHLVSGGRFYGDYLVAPFVDFKEPPTGGVRICRVAEIIIDRLRIISSLSAIIKIRTNVP